MPEESSIENSGDGATALDPDHYYWTAVSRNLGLVSREEQERLRRARIAIPGLGGLGGRYLTDLVRLGVGHFHLTDLDTFSLANINRQVGADSQTAGRPKLDVMSELALRINPTIEIRAFEGGLTEQNVESFLSGVDLVVDSIDFFSITARRLLYKAARQFKQTVLFSAPLGFSGTLHAFTPNGMAFEEYYLITDDMSPFEQLVNFAVGLTPRGTHWRYMDTSQVKFAEKAGPSLASACNVSAALVTTEALVILLERREPLAAPKYVQFDPYRCKYRTGRLIWGNRGPIQRLKRWIVRRQFQDQQELINRMCREN